MGSINNYHLEEPAMPIVILQMPDVKQKTKSRPQQCPYCAGETFQRWGKVIKPVRDKRYRNVQVYRYLCCSCRRTFRYYPQGVDRADQTQRMRKLAVLYWILGMSLRGVAIALSGFDVTLSHMTVWRDIQEQAAILEKKYRWHPVRVLGVDGMYPLVKGKKRPVIIAVDMGSGKPMAIGKVDESNPHSVKRWLEPLVKRLGVSVIVTDDLASFRVVAEKLEVEHQVCQFHVRRWVGRTLYELRQTVPKEWLWVLDEIGGLLSELPPKGSRRLFELWKQIPERRAGRNRPRSPLDRLRYLLIRLSEHWDSYRVFAWHNDVPWTNNGTEQAIGRLKMRSRTVRGYKSWHGMYAAFLLIGAGVTW